MDTRESSNSLAPPQKPALIRSKNSYNKRPPPKPISVTNSFFRNLRTQLKSRGTSINNFIFDLSLGNSVSLESFAKSLSDNSFAVAYDELESVFASLAPNNELELETLRDQLERHTINSNSDRSSDISSPRTCNSHLSANELNWNEECTLPEHVIDAIEYYSMIVRQAPKEQFLNRLNELPEIVKVEHMNRFMLERPFRLEEGVERNILVGYIMRNTSNESKEVIVDRILKEFYWWERKEFEKNYEQAMAFIADNSDAILGGCREIDRNERGKVTWSDLNDIIRRISTLESDVLFELKNKCFSYEYTLFSIPYMKLIEETAVI